MRSKKMKTQAADEKDPLAIGQMAINVCINMTMVDNLPQSMTKAVNTLNRMTKWPTTHNMNATQ